VKPGLAILLSCALLIASSVPPRVSRTAMAAMEKSMDSKIERMTPEDPYYLLGNTRGIYVEDYGAVFTLEINLVASAALSPFGRTSYTKEEIAKLKQKKQQRIFQLKQGMREMMMAAASSIDTVPPGEQIVVGALILYFSWEDSAGLPRQIIMQAPKKALIAAAKGDNAALEAVLRVREF
jgi:hypothetical protein